MVLPPDLNERYFVASLNLDAKYTSSRRSGVDSDNVVGTQRFNGPQSFRLLLGEFDGDCRWIQYIQLLPTPVEQSKLFGVVRYGCLTEIPKCQPCCRRRQRRKKKALL